MSPEQSRFEPTDARSDVFSLGVVLYEILAGRSLFGGGGDTIVTLEAVRRKEIPPIRSVNPAVPERLARVLDHALERDCEKRYQTAGKLGYDLEYFLYSEGFGPTNVTLHRYLRMLYPHVRSLIDPTVPDAYFDRLIARARATADAKAATATANEAVAGSDTMTGMDTMTGAAEAGTGSTR
jgi:serine/threonine protein kinase